MRIIQRGTRKRRLYIHISYSQYSESMINGRNRRRQQRPGIKRNLCIFTKIQPQKPQTQLISIQIKEQNIHQKKERASLCHSKQKSYGRKNFWNGAT